MNELEKKDKNELSLIDRLNLLKNKANRPALLLDCSGSMSSELEPGRSKIQALSNIVQSMKLYGIDIYVFNSFVTKVDAKNMRLYASGGTNLTAAFILAKSEGHDKCIVITDGQPDNQATALQASQGMQLEIMYVGPGQRPQFLIDLAAQSGGHSFQADLKDVKSIKDKVTLLLGSGAVAPEAASDSEENKKGPICL